MAKSKALAKREAAIVIKDTPGVRNALVSRFGDRDFGAALSVPMFIALCNKYELNPWMGHITPFEGRPYVQHDGWLHLINREAPGQLVALESRPADDDEYRRFKVSADDYFAIATLTRRWPGGNEVTFTRRALIPKRLAAASGKEATAVRERPGTAKTRPIVADPWDMAEKQARVRVMRMGFNDCLAGLAAAPASAQEVAVDAETGEVIEGEAIPAGNGADWSRLWVVASERGMEKSDVHDRFGAGPDDGDLKAYAEQRADKEGLPLQQIVQDMADELQHRANDPGAATEAAMQRQELEGDHEADERDRQDAEAALTQGDEPADPGLAE